MSDSHTNTGPTFHGAGYALMPGTTMAMDHDAAQASRRQLTLFLPHDVSATIEKIRSQYNPVQYRLIRAHVTLCREDEIEDLAQVLSNIRSLDERSVSIRFERPTRFEDGRGVYLPSYDTEAFDRLRARVLRDVIGAPRKHTPHITLMHPRNSTCDDVIFELICNEEFPRCITFPEISLIEQKNAETWDVLETY